MSIYRHRPSGARKENFKEKLMRLRIFCSTIVVIACIPALAQTIDKVDLRAPFDKITYEQSSRPVVGGNKSVLITVVLASASNSASQSDGSCSADAIRLDPLSVTERQPDPGIPVNSQLLGAQGSGLRYTFNIPIGPAGVLTDSWMTFSFRISFSCATAINSGQKFLSPTVQVQRLLEDASTHTLTFSSEPKWYKSGNSEHVDFAVQSNEEIKISQACLIRDPNGVKEKIGCSSGDNTTATIHYFTIVPSDGHVITTAAEYGYTVKASQLDLPWTFNGELKRSQFNFPQGDYTILSIDESRLILNNLNQSDLSLTVATSDPGALLIHFETPLPNGLAADLRETSPTAAQSHQFTIPVGQIGEGVWQFHFEGKRQSDSYLLAGIHPYFLKITSSTNLVGDLALKLDGQIATLDYSLSRNVPHKILVSSPDFTNQATKAEVTVNPSNTMCSNGCPFQNQKIDLAPLLNSTELQNALSNNRPVKLRIGIEDQSPDAKVKSISGITLLFTKPVNQVDAQKIADAQDVLKKNKNDIQQATQLVKQALTPNGVSPLNQASTDALVSDIVKFLSNNRDANKSNWVVSALGAAGKIAGAYFGIRLPTNLTTAKSDLNSNSRQELASGSGSHTN